MPHVCHGAPAVCSLRSLSEPCYCSLFRLAVVLDQLTDSVADDIALQPSDNPYTYLDEDEELAIDITENNPRIDAEGINVDAVAVQDTLFNNLQPERVR